MMELNAATAKQEMLSAPIPTGWTKSGFESRALETIFNAAFRPKDPLAGLLYLTNPEDREKSPLKEKQVQIAEASYRADRRTSKWLYGGITASTIVLLNPIAAPFDLNPWLLAGALSAIGIGVNAVSYLATGFFPDCSSQRADERLMMIFSAKRQYKAMAHKLLHLSKSEKEEDRELAYWIAEKINMNSIREKMALQLHDKGASKLVTKKLETVCGQLLKDKVSLQTV